MLKDNLDTQILVNGKAVTFSFRLVHYPDITRYHVVYLNENNQNETFRMERDENNQWKIMAQVLPTSIFDLEMELNDAIENAQE